MHCFGSPSIKSYCDSIIFMTPYALYLKRNKGYKRVVKLRLIQSKSILILFLFFPVSSVLALPHPCGTAAGYQKSYQKHSLCFLHFDQSKVNSKETVSASVSFAKYIQKKKKKRQFLLLETHTWTLKFSYMTLQKIPSDQSSFRYSYDRWSLLSGGGYGTYANS